MNESDAECRNMSTFDDFSKDQRVTHISLGDGTVTHVNTEFVFVAYDKHVIKGKPCTGQYDRRWFELYPTFLFHRSEP